ncbi:hypothetical protein [Desmospora profundinema]|uniref:Uncharacterized protein n=1 Tax=Desmospora profundinema TaxID=1571184 RepID=A0ABU1IRN5_9BACL|nr:hypothetical protein [Desmospora profundinema]MDR6227346.1 hypothetical protein [Desmospora profundinema]
MKLRGQVQRRKARIRKAAFFSFVGSLVLTGFITPPIVQAPQGYKPDLSMEENRSNERTHPEKPGVQLSREKTQENLEAEPTDQPKNSWYALKQDEQQTIEPVHTATDTQQNWSRPRSNESVTKEEEPAVTSVPTQSPADEDEQNANQPGTGPDDQPREPENEEERSPEDGKDDPSSPDEPTEPGEGEEPVEPGEGNDEPKDGDESDGDDRDERNPYNTLKEWLIQTKESDLAS